VSINASPSSGELSPRAFIFSFDSSTTRSCLSWKYPGPVRLEHRRVVDGSPVPQPLATFAPHERAHVRVLRIRRFRAELHLHDAVPVAEPVELIVDWSANAGAVRVAFARCDAYSRLFFVAC
jgi:hypothetical protein